ncbi:molybdate ABC transporter substrate-binding protein [soil metagenome]
MAQSQSQSQNEPAGMPPLRVYAAGSLRRTLTEIAGPYEAATGVRLMLTLGASGLLRERIEDGEPAQVFVSADMTHPQTLARNGGQWQPPLLFMRNQLCALTAPGETATTDTLLERMLSPDVKLGTSTPGSDPAGDYAWALFRKADLIQPGAFAVLDGKALKLTGATGAAKAPAGRGTYAWLMDEGRADIFLTYRTNAMSARQEVAGLKVVEIPAALEVSVSYGLTTRSGDAAAARFARYLLSPPAQAVFRQAGFAAP